MSVLYIVSAEEGAGKTAICAGIAVNLLDDGKKIGYLKPQAAEKGAADGDIAFMRRATGQADIVNAPDIVAGRDMVLVEAMLGASPNDPASKDAYGAAKDMQAKVIAVEAYSGRTTEYEPLYQGFGESFLGLVINKVPKNKVKEVKKQAENSPVKIIGVIPEDRTLLAITVAELAESVNGKIISKEENAGELVENYMLGAMVPDSGADYFSRKKQKAAIIRQERADMQLAALETPTAALVLAGSSKPPIYNVKVKAGKKGVPVITTESEIADIVEHIESTISKARINQDKKLAKLGDMVKQNLDMKVSG